MSDKLSDKSKAIVSVKNVSKSFKLPHERIRSLKGVFVNMFRRNSYERQQVLKDISLEVKDGEFLGIIGRNGSGKSTLLKLLAGIYVPDSGEITLRGKLTPFIELGVGFNPELTGRENIYLNGALLGFDTKAMDSMYDQIVEFAELEKFMDQKLKNYSSGMQVRLAFSIAIQARTEILLIDEVLAVGDANFQRKCFDVFENFKQEGRTIIFVSHSMGMVKRFCDRAILIDRGKIRAEGEPDIVATEYDLLNAEKKKPKTKKRLPIKTRREARIVDTVLSLFDKEDDYLLEVGSGSGRHVELLNSIGVKAIGLDKDNPDEKNKVYENIGDIDLEKITGLLILDNLKSINLGYLDSIFSILNSEKLKDIKKVYVHLPFHMYQEYLKEKDSKSSPHLGNPIDITDVSALLEKSGFITIRTETYGTDKEVQYVEAVYERLTNDLREELWG